MTPPLATPLILRSSLAGKLKAKTADPVINAGIVDKIIEASATLQFWAKRRFDERIETRYYTAGSANHGHGDIEGGDLLLDDDLRTVSILTNGDGSVIDSSVYHLLPRSVDVNGVNAVSRVRPDPFSAVVWQYGNTDPVDSISVAGSWGYGGQWKNTGITVTSGLAADASAASFVASAALELGMMLKIGSEYIYVSGVSGTATTIERACNGSTAAVHVDGSPVYRWEAHPLVQKLVTRLTLISIEQDSSPLFSQLVLADTAVPVSSDGIAKDILFDLQKMGLRRKQRIMAI